MSRQSAAWYVAVGVLILVGAAHAENIDPSMDGSQYAYGENVGWINGEPSGGSGPGVQVGDFRLTGFLWSENTGWISLSCENTGSCGTAPHGVIQDGSGNLSGRAWAENVGWIDFAPRISGAPVAGAGVQIDPSTGIFAGSAWSENAGWIRFSFQDPVLQPYQMETSWRCDPPPSAPGPGPDLSLTPAGSQVLISWLSLPGATGYDLVEGDLLALRSSGGDFVVSTTSCLLRKGPELSALSSASPGVGEAVWFAVRGANCGGVGTFEGGGAQAGSRDAEIAASGNGCE